MNFRKSIVEKSNQLQERLRIRELEKAEREATRVDTKVKEKVVKKVDKKGASVEEEAFELSEVRSPQEEVFETAATSDNLEEGTQKKVLTKRRRIIGTIQVDISYIIQKKRKKTTPLYFRHLPLFLRQV